MLAAYKIVFYRFSSSQPCDRYPTRYTNCWRSTARRNRLCYTLDLCVSTFKIPDSLEFVLYSDWRHTKKENLAVIIISYARAGARVRETRFVKKIFLNQGFREIWSWSHGKSSVLFCLVRYLRYYVKG